MKNLRGATGRPAVQVWCSGARRLIRPGTPRRRVRVLFMNRPGVFQGASGVGRVVRGGAEIVGPERLELVQDLEVFQSVLPRLLVGYQLYLAAATASESSVTEMESSFQRAGDVLSSALLAAER